MSPTLFRLIQTCLVGFLSIGLAQAADGGATKADAEAMVKKAVALIKSDGAEKSYAQFNDKAGKFILHDLYIVVYGLDGVVHAHGANAKMIGKISLSLKTSMAKLS